MTAIRAERVLPNDGVPREIGQGWGGQAVDCADAGYGPARSINGISPAITLVCMSIVSSADHLGMR